MNSVRLIILGVALVAGVACVALLSRGFASSKPRLPAPVSAPAPTVRVLVAKRTLNVGEHVGEADMSWQPWPAEALNPAYITDGPVRTQSPDLAGEAGKVAQAAKDVIASPAQGAGAGLVGAIVRERILAGEPFNIQKLVHPGTAGAMAVALSPGSQAMAIPLSAESAAGGFILPGDHVDIVVNRQVDGAEPTGPMAAVVPGAKHYVADTVLRNVKVLAIDQNTGPQKGDAVVGATATVEVAPDQVGRLVTAKAAGQLTLALRSYADAAGPPMTGQDPQAPGRQPEVVHVFRPHADATVAVAQ